jgi:predicted nucleic acid-binding protein
MAREAVFGWSDSFEVVDSTWSAFQFALDLVVDHNMSIWAALILSIAAEHRCRLLLSEDFQDGFVWRGLTVVNPLVKPVSPHLERLPFR